MKRLLCLWLPAWPIQRRLAVPTDLAKPGDPAKPANSTESTSPAEPTNSTKPVILWHADPRRGRVVAAACVRARSAGVRLGMPVAQAADLAAMTDAIFEPHDRDADREALQSLAIEFQNHLSPRTAVETLDRFKWFGRHRHDPEAIISEINGVTHLFGDERELLATAAGQLQKRGLSGRFAIADTLGAAWALANTAPSPKNQSPKNQPPKNQSPQKPSPKAAARKKGFEFFIAPPGQTVTALQTLPPAALRLSPDTVATLSRLGVETLGSLLRLPRDGLATRLGVTLCDRIAQATGEVDEPLVALESPSDHSASLVLEYPTDAMDLISDRLERLIDQAIVDLQTLHRGVLRLRCHLDFTAHPPAVLESGLFAPTLDRSHLTQLMLGALQSHRLGSKVTQMTICVAQHAPLSSRQPSIFGPDFRSGSGDDWTRQSEAARLIDVLSGRLGEDCVRGVRLSDDSLPESSIVDFPMSTHRMRKVTGGQVSGGQRTYGIGGPPRTNDLGRRPLELLAEPSPITPIDTGGREADTVACDHFPVAFRIRGRSRAVHRHWGPERIETRWWRGPLIRRDYFRVELVDASRLWIYHDLTVTGDDKRWFLHGRFA